MAASTTGGMKNEIGQKIDGEDDAEAAPDPFGPKLDAVGFWLIATDKGRAGIARSPHQGRGSQNVTLGNRGNFPGICLFVGSTL
jgi:hypothetical protein